MKIFINFQCSSQFHVFVQQNEYIPHVIFAEKIPQKGYVGIAVYTQLG